MSKLHLKLGYRIQEDLRKREMEIEGGGKVLKRDMIDAKEDR